MTLESSHPSRAGRVHISEKPARAQATATARRPPSARLSRIRALENQVQELEERLYAKEIECLLDLRIASGLDNEKERSKSAANLARIPADALMVMRTDLVKVLARLNSVASSPVSSTGSCQGDDSYIA